MQNKQHARTSLKLSTKQNQFLEHIYGLKENSTSFVKPTNMLLHVSMDLYWTDGKRSTLQKNCRYWTRFFVDAIELGNKYFLYSVEVLDLQGKTFCFNNILRHAVAFLRNCVLLENLLRQFPQTNFVCACRFCCTKEWWISTKVDASCA